MALRSSLLPILRSFVPKQQASTMRLARTYSTNFAEVDASVQQQYKDSDLSFYKFPVDQVEFKVGSHFISKKPHPELFFGDNDNPGILHIAPFANACFVHFGLKGNVGKEFRFGSTPRTIETLQEADNEISLSDYPISGGEGHNEMLGEYFEWLNQLQDKYLDHLTENISEYPALNNKQFTKFLDNEKVLRDLIESKAVALQRPFKNPEDKTDLDNNFLSFKRKLFSKSSKKQQVSTPEDDEMFAQGYVRNHVPVFQAGSNQEIPLQDLNLRSGDVIAISSNIMCNLYDVGGNISCGLRRNLRSITFYRSKIGAEEEDDAPVLRVNM